MNMTTKTGHDARTQATIDRMTTNAERILRRRIAADSRRLLPGESPRLFAEQLTVAIENAVADEIRSDPFAEFEKDTAPYRGYVRTEWMCRHVDAQSEQARTWSPATPTRWEV